jgi:hypothetical protein
MGDGDRLRSRIPLNAPSTAILSEPRTPRVNALRRPTNVAAAFLIVCAIGIAAAFSWQHHRTRAAPLPSGTIGAVDAPADEAVIGNALRVSGWALDPAGIRAVEIRLDGHAYPARYGIARADVAQIKPGYPDSAESGFSFEGNFGPLEPARHEVAIIAINRQGSEKVLARKSLLPPGALTQWQPLYASRRADAAAPFFVLPGLSGIALGGAAELDNSYSSYMSATVKIGMRVPILYLRTTLGRTRDWEFDPGWNIERRCGERRIAEDSLSTVIAYAVLHKLPVLFTLNGGIWADAVCDVPEWDVNDHLEQDKANCQWNEHDEVMADDYFKNLPGAGAAPELGRSLTLNIYATQNRHFKRRNLQSAGRIVAGFAAAHPELFAGVNLDPDTYLNPFFEEKQWYDYNPGTLRQFREWLAGSGPYAIRPERGVPDLSRYRRARPLSLAEVRKLSGKPFRSWDEVDPPRTFPREGKPFWQDPWVHEWEVFRRHLVNLHYDDLSRWLADAGVAPSRIFSSQGFIAPYPAALPFAVRIDSPTKNYDSGGMSVEGAIPHDGHLGAIVYGAGAVNDVRMEDDANLFATFHRMDRGWAVVEFNTADFRTPAELPSYAMGYRALREMFNYGARFASPMAWNGSNGIYAGQPGYVSFMAWRNTPLEDAMRDFAVSHAFVPQGARLWTFGSPRLVDADGWSAAVGTLEAGPGHVDLTSANGEVTLVSPSPLALGGDESDLLAMGVAADQVRNIISVAVEGTLSDGTTVALAAPRPASELVQTSAGISVPLICPATAVTIDRIRVTLTMRDPNSTLRLRHLALYPVAPPLTSRLISVITSPQ